MSGASIGLRTGSYGSLQHLHLQNGGSYNQSGLVRKPSKMALSSSREKERFLSLICRYLGRRKVAMLLLVVLALLVFVFGSFTVSKESNVQNIAQDIEHARLLAGKASLEFLRPPSVRAEDAKRERSSSRRRNASRSDGNRGQVHSPHRPRLRPRFHLRSRPHVTSSSSTPVGHASPRGQRCENFAFPPPPPPDRKRIGPRPCPVCYLPVEDAISSMPKSPTISPVLQNLTYIHNEDPVKVEPHGGSYFGGYPSLKERNDSFDIKESMKVHCGFVKGSKPGCQTGFDIDEADLVEMERSYDVIVASGIFGNYDVIQQPKNISEAARKNIPFFMFIDEETEAYMKNSSILDSSMRVGLWKIIVVHNTPFSDARRNGKVPKLLLHRLFPNVRYSIWIDGKLELVVDPYQVLERFLWRQNASFAISRHYRRFDVFEEAEANKAAGKYENSSIDYQIDFYRKEGLSPYSEAKLPITSDVPEGCVIIREHIPITNLFTCLWFNEVDRFTSRDQLSFSTVRDKIAAKVNWTVSMFLDCERRNFVIQAYHRDLLEQMSPPVIPTVRPRTTLPLSTTPGRPPPKKSISKRGRGERKANSRRHRKVIAGGGRDKILF